MVVLSYCYPVKGRSINEKIVQDGAHLFALAAMFALVVAACGSQSSGSNGSSPVTVNLDYFPNLTHAVALVGVARGTFQQRLGPNVKLVTKTFNAGPAEIEALFAGDIDIGFVGPGPAINGYIKSNRQALRIIAGASSGGVLFVVRPGANINSPQKLVGKKLADPQVGGTQDIALRTYLQQHGLKPQIKAVMCRSSRPTTPPGHRSMGFAGKGNQARLE